MKLLAFSDLHRDREAAERLVELASEADVVVGAGDYATIRIGLERTMETLSVIATATVLVPGNAESDTELWRGLRGVAERRRPSRPGEGDCGRPVLWARGRGPSDAVSVEL